ncbi:MAG TPA: ATP phosphoribosyltransferase regulatory subunit [Burkholderiales bacterium]|nr:ATP phosphoribosyltransferase regulatory subunit [Burkholderiales bacterium]
MRNWILPEYIDDILPPEAEKIERLRGLLLELFARHGYLQVIPPLLEFTESLLTGTGHDLDLVTFKLVDQLSGRLMGLRADITPQVARIDSHLMRRKGVTRLCYAGSIVRTIPTGLSGARELQQIGAELYGHSGLEADIEILSLMLEALGAAHVADIRLDLGHVGVFRTLIKLARVASELEAEIFNAVKAKDEAEIRALTGDLAAADRAALMRLPTLYGGVEILDCAARDLPDDPVIAQALSELRALAHGIDAVAVDLSELRGYQYHSGVVFAAFGGGRALAYGGRYDEVGRAFGNARPATGFSMDLRELARASPLVSSSRMILAPHSNDPALQKKIAELRHSGERVAVALPGHSQTDCDRALVLRDGVWQVEER